MNSTQQFEQHKTHEGSVTVRRAVTINRSIEDLYHFWRDPTHLPEAIGFIESVQVRDDHHAHWTVRFPLGQKFDFDVEVYQDLPDELIAWRSVPDSSLQTSGAVRFQPAPAGRGTQVHLLVEFVPPLGMIGQAFLKMFDEAPNQYIGQYLREFKQLMETGEKATTKGQTSGRESEVDQ